MTQMFQISTNSAFTFDFNANRNSYRMRVVHNDFNDSYSFDILRRVDNTPLLCGITLSTCVNLLSQFNWFKLWVLPTKPELYDVNPTSATITQYQIWVEDEL